MIDFNAHPDHYRHWSLKLQGPIARLDLCVDPEHPLREGYELKLNSYDLAVDIELQDAIQRIRFEHPEIKVVQIGSGLDRVFCAGANIGMLGSSSHPFKVNFCKFTNETRCSIEDASQHSGIKFIAALNGTCAGGGYELALACDEIYLVDDGNSAVSLPEVALLGVLPGTGGLTRLVDKRKVRRDYADMFSTLAEGVKGKRAKKWELIDDTFPKSKFKDRVEARVQELAKSLPDKHGDISRGMALSPIHARVSDEDNRIRYDYEHVSLTVDNNTRLATLVLEAPKGKQPQNPDEYFETGDRAWAVRCFRELDDALLHLRFEHEQHGLILLKTIGGTSGIDALLAVEKSLVEHKDHWLVHEILLQMARVLRRYELSARSLFALAEKDSCFGGVFLELALAGDRLYMLDDPENPVGVAVGPLSNGLLPMSNGLTRLQSRFLKDPAQATRLATGQPRVQGQEADELGLVTALIDELDWDDDVRIAIEERASLSPDALTGMEASLRFGGAETCDSKIFGRLSAWQNWIFTRPNATGEKGALTRYGQPEPARFDWRRT
jgi:benzoyl-CoA-dihydrodiol lyase